MRNLDNFRQVVEYIWATFVQKLQFFAAKILNTDDLSNNTFNCLCKNSPNSLSFLKP